MRTASSAQSASKLAPSRIGNLSVRSRSTSCDWLLSGTTVSSLTRHGVRNAERNLTQSLNLVPYARCLLELEIARELHHFRVQFLDPLQRLLGRHRRVIGARIPHLALLDGTRAFHHVADRLDDGAGRDAVLGIELDLLAAASVGFRDGALDRAGSHIRIKNRLAADVARRAADGLNQRTLGA